MADCACVYVGAIEEAERDWIKTRTARKPNVCGECGRQIEAGEQYEHWQQLYDGGWSSYTTCADCLSIRKSFFCDGWFFECVLEHLREHIEGVNGEVASECIVPLTPRAREMVCKMIEKAWAHLEDEDD